MLTHNGQLSTSWPGESGIGEPAGALCCGVGANVVAGGLSRRQAHLGVDPGLLIATNGGARLVLDELAQLIVLLLQNPEKVHELGGAALDRPTSRVSPP